MRRPVAEEAKARSSRDFFVELVKGSQPRPEFLAERERWLRSVQVDGREELLFEFEMLLRGLERYFSLHNLPFDPANPPVVTRNFAEELVDVRDALEQAIRLARRLLDPDSEGKLQFRRYVESQLMADDRARRELLEQELEQDTPQEALFVLRQAFESLRTIIDHLLKLEVSTYALFSEVGNLALREIVLNRFFRPFRSLEFRLEYDRIRSVPLLEALCALGEVPRRHFTVALLGAFRLLHYLSYAGNASRAAQPRARVVLALVRSEALTLIGYLKDEAAPHLEKKRHRVGILKLARDLQRAVRSVSEQLVGDLSERGSEYGAAVGLTATLRLGIVALARVLDIAPPEEGDDFSALVSTEEMAQRLRQDLWAFADLCRSAQGAFALDDDDGDAAMDALGYLREYVGYFQDVSYHLLRYGDFEAFDRFAERISALVLPPEKAGERARLAEECRLFTRAAEATFDHAARRSELLGQRFDRHAAERLRSRFRAD